MVSTHITTTPAATRRAETSFTGSGNEKSECTLLGALPAVTPLLMTCSLPEADNPEQFSRVSPAYPAAQAPRRLSPRRAAPAGAGAAPRSGRRAG